MNRLTYTLLALLALSLCGADWLQFRGPNGTAVAENEQPPVEWSGEKNIAWQVKMPGRGVSSPIVVDGRVIVTSNAGPKQERIMVLAYDETSGELLWRREFWATGRTASHPTSANAAPSPASDGERIYAFYSSNDLICLDLDGNLVWLRGLAHDYPKAGNDVGMASSPVLAGNTVVVQIENQGDSFAAGIDKETGETKWRLERPTQANWASPIASAGRAGGQDFVLLQSGEGLIAVDPETGAEQWSYNQPCATVASASTTPGEVYVPCNGLTVLRIPDGSSSPEVVWESNRVSPGSASAIVSEDKVYALNRAGVLTCASREDGEIEWQQRLRGTFWGTPVLAGEHIYAVNQDGRAFVVDIGGRRPEIEFEFEFEQPVLASPVVSDNALYVRSDTTLWRIAKP